MRSRLFFVLGLALLAVLCWLAAVRIDFAALARHMRGYDPLAVLAAAGSTLLSYLLLGWRFSGMSRGRVGVMDAAKAEVLTIGYNSVLPLRMGELVKVAYLAFVRKSLPASEGLSLTLWARFWDVNALLALLLCGAGSGLGWRMLPPVLGVTVVLWGLLLLLWRFPGLRPKVMSLLPGARLRRHAGELLESVLGHFRPGLLAPAALWTCALWASCLLTYHLVLAGVCSVHIPLSGLFYVVVACSLGYNVGITPGGVGIFEGIMILALSWFGVPAEVALGAGLLLRAITLVPTVAASLLITLGSGWRHLLQRGRELEGNQGGEGFVRHGD